MQYIEVQYNRELKPLEAILSGVKHPGEFFVAGVVEIPMPRVEVKGAGTLSFPIPLPQIEAIVQHATRAPYGRGEETIVDTSVRNVWQLAPGAVKISGKSWAASFEDILSKVTAGLGCHGAAFSAEFYKLLVYDRGGFFLAHRDTEKTAGMFGTLVLTLPSAHGGGALGIRHADREVTVETNATDPSEISFAAFYADCEHEALPVREGNRVCLVYNLIQERMKGKRRILKASNYGSEVEKAAAILKAYWAAPSAQMKIAWLLDHQYSPAGLSFSSLKGADAARSRVLLQAAGLAECVAHLGVVHIGETGGAEADGDYYSSSRRRRYGGYDHDEEEESDDEDTSFTPVSVDDIWQYLDEWRDTDDRVVEFGRIPLAAGELLPAGALDQEPPDDKRLTEASGNEGVTYERSYHRAALVLWPAGRMIDVLLAGGVAATLPYLKRLAAGGKGTRPAAVTAAQRVVEAWPADDALRPAAYSIGVTSREGPDRATMIALLVKLNAPPILEQFIRNVVVSAYDGSENAALLRSVSVIGEMRAAAVLSALVGARMADRPGGCAELLRTLTPDPSPSFRQVAEAAVAGLDVIGIPDSEPDDTFEWWEKPEDRRQRPLAPEFIANLFAGLQHFNGRTLCDAAAGKIASRPEVFHPVTLVVPAIEQICGEPDHPPPAVARALQHLWTSAAEFLLLRSEAPPQPPADWRLHAELLCTCADCHELQAFARDPSERVHRFRVKKERRGHLHRVIDRHRLDMTHATERLGSPQTLVCTKDRRTFQARMKEYQHEIAAMRKLVKLAPKCGAAAALSRRMEAGAKASAI